METGVYVDILLVLNYIINMLLLAGVAKLTGRSPKRRKIVAAALCGSISSLTIFLPFMGFFASVAGKLLLSGAIVLVAFGYGGIREFGRQLFVFFSVSFFFAGVMLGIWMVFRPRGMLYYNGVVYFDISSLTLIATTVLAYIALSLGSRVLRAKSLKEKLCDVQVFYGGKSAAVRGLVDSGNSLREPFSGTPVMVCGIEAMAALLPEQAVRCIREGGALSPGLSGSGVPFRLVPYSALGGEGMIPAFKADRLVLCAGGERYLVESAYVGVSGKAVGGRDYNAVLSPDFMHRKIVTGGVKR